MNKKFINIAILTLFLCLCLNVYAGYEGYLDMNKASPSPLTATQDGYMLTYDNSTKKLAWVSPLTASTIDHGLLTGLADDDHPQYAEIAEAENISGSWEIQDNVQLSFGNDSDWKIDYDETYEDTFRIFTTENGSTRNDANPMFLINVAVGGNLDDNQSILSIEKNSTPVLKIDEDGDMDSSGDLDIDGGDIFDNGSSWLEVSSCGAGTSVNTVSSSGTITCVANTDNINDADHLTNNEGLLSVESGASNTSIIRSNTTGSSDITLTAGTNITLSENTTNDTITIDSLDIDNYVDEASFNTSTGVLSLGRTGTLLDVTTDLDGRYALNSNNSDDQKIDTFSLSGNTLSLSLENDGESAKTVNLGNIDFTKSNTSTCTSTNEGEIAYWISGTGADTVGNFWGCKRQKGLTATYAWFMLDTIGE